MRRSTFLAGTGAFAVAGSPRSASAAPGTALDRRSAVPVVRARAAGRELVLAIDTGDAVSSLSPAAAGALGLRVPSAASSSSALATLSGITVAGVKLRDHRVAVTDVASWTPLVGFAVDGSLGYEALRDRVVTLDYPNRRLVFPNELPDGEKTTITWLKYHDRSPELVTFEGLSIDAFAVTTQLDTAMAKNAIVFTSKVPDLAIIPDAKAPLYFYEEATLQPGRVGSIRLGTTLLAANVLIYTPGAGAHVPTTTISAVAGDQLFANRAVTLDFPNSALIVT